MMLEIEIGFIEWSESRLQKSEKYDVITIFLEYSGECVRELLLSKNISKVSFDSLLRVI